MSENKTIISNLSSFLFWDVDINNVDMLIKKKMIIQRVLQYGLFDDWKIIQKLYGIEDIAKTATTIRDLDDKSMSFISTISNTPKELFLCYTIKQSIPKHWNF